MTITKKLAAKALLVATLATTTFGGASLAAAPAGQDVPEIQVSGTATRSLAPSYAMLTLGITSQDASVNTAKSANDRVMSDLISRLTAMGITKNNIQTSNISINPNYDYNANNTRNRNTITGYTVSNTVNVKITDINKVDKVIDAAVASGATNVNSLNFENDVTQALNDQLTTEAIKNARHQAEIIAAALGRSVGGVKNVSVSGTQSYEMDNLPRMYKLAASMSTATPVEGGSTTVTKNASITFYLQ